MTGTTTTARLASQLGTSIRLAAFAYALSSWVEGTSQLRELFMLDSSSSSDLDAFYPPRADMRNRRGAVRSTGKERNVFDRLFEWITRKGRIMDEAEKMGMAGVNVLSSLLTLRLIGLKPLVPFLFSPFTATFTLPPTLIEQGRRMKWGLLLLAMSAMVALQESEKLIVALAVKWHRRRAKAMEEKVEVRGSRIHLPRHPSLPTSPLSSGTSTPTIFSPILGPTVDPSEDRECLICSGFGLDAYSVVSNHSLLDTEALPPAPPENEPLHGVCTLSPDKHLMHVQCFERWQQEYLKARAGGDGVEVRFVGPEAAFGRREEIIAKARAVVRRAGMAYLAPALMIAPQLPPGWDRLMGGSSTPRPILTLYPPPQNQPSNSPRTPSNKSHRIATLRTTSPPCPACRSPVELHIYHRERRQTVYKQSLLKVLVKLLKADASKLVTGRTVIMRALTQAGFLAMLVVMMRKKGKGGGVAGPITYSLPAALR
ncbi:hypothetical protein M407DRAFT_18971 [Tulasnella calospora MUT 4182]|uniref:Uncharacterized protein n=1 Tax=Tulasnella calospora MUT 4182 TaxID=1051891 RepID=A0A0C3LE01_9AGAM|nr:hypothetical protein M407DRAFT_18971 [Tulasnella calospora MUT 4182]